MTTRPSIFFVNNQIFFSTSRCILTMYIPKSLKSLSQIPRHFFVVAHTSSPRAWVVPFTPNIKLGIYAQSWGECEWAYLTLITLDNSFCLCYLCSCASNILNYSKGVGWLVLCNQIMAIMSWVLKFLFKIN